MIFLTLCSEVAGSPAISEISPAILEKFIMSLYVHISRVNAAGFVMRYLTIEYSVLHLLRYSSK
jgi:hypothetical protein